MRTIPTGRLPELRAGRSLLGCVCQRPRHRIGSQSPTIADPQAGAPHHPELSMAAHLLEREEVAQ